MAPPRRLDPGSPSPILATGSTFLGILSAPLHNYRRALGLRSDRSALTALTRAIGSSWNWPATTWFVARMLPTPVLGILGESGDLDPARMRVQVRAAESGVGKLRYIGYGEAEAAVERLAALLVERFGAEPLRRFRWTALPRGGLIVLGMLASRLDLPPERLSAGPPGDEADSPLGVVDDCALSGARFADFLAGCPARQVVFAPLYSPPALRVAIESREPHVLACVAAHDLEDGGIGERWGERLDGERYGPGTGDRIAFPWNEPDRLIWNPESREVELGWKLVPPERCLKQRSRTGSAARPRIQIQPRGAGPWRPAPTVLFGWRRGETIVHRLDSGQVFRLRGTAHAMWWALLRGGDLAPALRLLAGRYHVGAETLGADLSRFVQELQGQDLLTFS